MENDLISRQDAIDVAVNYRGNHDITIVPNTRWTDGFETGWKLREDDILNGLADLPPAQPYPEIIRCKDCKYWEQKIGDEYHALGDCDFLKRGLVMCEGYCAWAEPR